jgi:hypothetical protein
VEKFISGSGYIAPRIWNTSASAEVESGIWAPFRPQKEINPMATDYDEPRVRPEDQPANESLEAIQAQRSATTQTALIDVEDGETAEGIDLPGADLSHEELLIQVIPQQEDEFTCMSCFLVHHRSQLAREKSGDKYCKECEG